MRHGFGVGAAAASAAGAAAGAGAGDGVVEGVCVCATAATPANRALPAKNARMLDLKSIKIYTLSPPLTAAVGS